MPGGKLTKSSTSLPCPRSSSTRSHSDADHRSAFTIPQGSAEAQKRTNEENWRKYCIETENSFKDRAGFERGKGDRATLPKARREEYFGSVPPPSGSVKNHCKTFAVDEYQASCDLALENWSGGNEPAESVKTPLERLRTPSKMSHREISLISSTEMQNRANKSDSGRHINVIQNFGRNSQSQSNASGSTTSMLIPRMNGYASIPEGNESSNSNPLGSRRNPRMLRTAPLDRPHAFCRSISAYGSHDQTSRVVSPTRGGSAGGSLKSNMLASTPRKSGQEDANRRFVQTPNSFGGGGQKTESDSLYSCSTPTSPTPGNLASFRCTPLAAPDRRASASRADRQSINQFLQSGIEYTPSGARKDSQQCNSLPRFVGRQSQSNLMNAMERNDSVVGVAALGSSVLSQPNNPRGPRGSGDWPSKQVGSSNGGQIGGESGLGKRRTSREEDLHGSMLSLISNVSSAYSTAEEKQAQEMRKLKRELELAQEKISTLTTQLTTNVHVVTAFEQSLSSMTHRLQKLTNASEHKDSELSELRKTLQSLQQQSRAHFGPMSGAALTTVAPGIPVLNRQGSLLVTSSSKDSNVPVSAFDSFNNRGTGVHLSMDNVSMMTNASGTSVNGLLQQQQGSSLDKKHKKTSWLKSSITKAFGRRKPKQWSEAESELNTSGGSNGPQVTTSVPSSPLLHSAARVFSVPNTPSINASRLSGESVGHGIEVVLELQQQLHDKDMKLTDIRLEALSSAHHLESLRDTMNRMKNEIVSLKSDNERMQRMINEKGLNCGGDSTSEDSASASLPPSGRISLGDPTRFDAIAMEALNRNVQRFTIAVRLGPMSRIGEGEPATVLIGTVAVTNKTSWDTLDSAVRRIFKEYLVRLDPTTSMGLSGSSVVNYNIGEIVRTKGAKAPELLPCGYLVGDSTNIVVTLKGHGENSVDSLSFEMVVPKSIVQRYISLVLEHRRLILCGPSGTGKTYLAQKLAEYLVLASGKESTAGLIATFNVDQKSGRELRQYLSNIADQCEHSSADLPSVIILDNLHHVGSLAEAFNPLLGLKYQLSPYIIGTMSQTAPTATNNLQLHHNFRWVLCTNHVEPVRGFLARYLQRRLVEEEVTNGGLANDELAKIVEWLPRVWQHLSRFLETYCSADITIGPRLFLSCPMDVTNSQVWFTDLWNYSIIPYVLEAVREGVQTYGQRAQWENPTDWVMENYPWKDPRVSKSWPSLLHLRSEDVGYESQSTTTSTSVVGGTTVPKEPVNQSIESESAEGAAGVTSSRDPLMTMLLRLQEAASYSSTQSNESDSASLDSHCGSTERISSLKTA